MAKGWSFGALIDALKGAAFLDVGTTANTVAAGNDTRIVNAVRKTGDTMSGPLTVITDAYALNLRPASVNEASYIRGITSTGLSGVAGAWYVGKNTSTNTIALGAYTIGGLTFQDQTANATVAVRLDKTGGGYLEIRQNDDVHIGSTKSTANSVNVNNTLKLNTATLATNYISATAGSNAAWEIGTRKGELSIQHYSSGNASAEILFTDTGYILLTPRANSFVRTAATRHYVGVTAQTWMDEFGNLTGSAWAGDLKAYLNRTFLGIGANAVSATKLATARLIGGVNFDGTASINLPGVNTAGNQNTTGNAATSTLAASATKLATARTINGVSFDGTADINLPNSVVATGSGDGFYWRQYSDGTKELFGSVEIMINRNQVINIPTPFSSIISLNANQGGRYAGANAFWMRYFMTNPADLSKFTVYWDTVSTQNQGSGNLDTCNYHIFGRA